MAAAAAEDRLDRVLRLVRTHVPGLVLLHKAESPLFRAVNRAMRPINPRFETHFTTVIGSTVYLPRPVEQIHREELAATLCHELVHQLDQKRWGPLFYASYAVLGPAGRTTRAVWERRAYVVDLLIARERAGQRGIDRELERLVGLFSGPAYGYMWAGRDAARAFLRPSAEAVAQRTIDTEAPYDEILKAWRGA